MNLRKFSLLVSIFYLLFFLVLPHTEYQPADPGIKVLQVKDFILSGYSTFSASYLGKTFDPEFKYFHTKPPFAYILSSNAYYVFPYFVTILYAPFYVIGGVYALEFLSVLSGLATIFVIYKISILLGLSEKFRKLMLIFSAIGSITSVYAFILGEGVHASLLITVSTYLILRAKDNSSSIAFFLSGILAGISVLFRIELAFFCFLLVVGVFLFQMYSRKIDLVLLLFGLSLPALILIFTNYKITGNILGLRGIEFLQNSGGDYPMAKRFYSLFKALIVSDKGLGLFTAWPVFLYLIPFYISVRNIKSQQKLSFLLFLSIVFTILIPMIVKNDDGSILGPRFAAALQPLLIPAVFYSIELTSKSEKFTKWISALPYLIYYSVFITFLGYAILFLFLKNSHRINVDIEQKISGEIIILRKPEFSSLVFPSIYKKPVLTIESSEDLSEFLKLNLANIPKSLSIINYETPENKEIILPKGFEYELINSFPKNGMILQNIIIKNQGEL